MYRDYVKSFLDLCFALIAIIITLPLIAVIALVIKLEDGGPVTFKQKRFGQNKQPFIVYKFRTMKVSAPSEMPTNSLLNADDHITRFGRIMRKLSLDEIPQLVNVLRGEMSLVGPRPVILKETDLITLRQKYNANSCKPGITGWAQVNGRDEVRILEKAKMDGEYVRNLGPLMDLKCILMTIYAVLSIKGHREGADSSQQLNDFREGEVS